VIKAKRAGRTAVRRALPRPAELPADLVRAARRAARRAHAPYSNFSVGAALRDASGGIFPGANLENAAYPLGVCAERVALLAWRARSRFPLTEAVIFTPTLRPTPPCGQCRQALLRWAPEARIYLEWLRGASGPHRAAEWLPAAKPEGARR
jgi:cytidine deaminase